MKTRAEVANLITEQVREIFGLDGASISSLEGGINGRDEEGRSASSVLPKIGIDQSKYCSFHDGRGHTTDECYELGMHRAICSGRQTSTKSIRAQSSVAREEEPRTEKKESAGNSHPRIARSLDLFGNTYTTWLSNVVMVKSKREVESVYRLQELEQECGATYQRMMNKVFARRIGRNVEVYIDDMIVKTLDRQRHIQDPADICQTRTYRIRPNRPNVPLASPRKFTGFMLD
ncbi:hypothetical protein K1719_014580 [Acacia pycnantha]|nr:hypothetical protein K1719_014580 [Acacia pycnantha]